MILGHSNPNKVLQIPEALLKGIRSHGRDDLSSLVKPLVMPFHTAQGNYVCQVYWLNEPPADLPSSIVVVLHRDTSIADTINVVADAFGLTAREREALIGISLGLCSKELAVRMNISPNTVKTYLRLIMLKVGVSTRSELLATMLYAGGRSALKTVS